MSAQIGRWHFDGEADDPAFLADADSLLLPYGPDRSGSYRDRNVQILYRGFHTTPESEREKQPRELSSGQILTWDGRLDNREELIADLGPVPGNSATDAEIVGAAIDRWALNSLPRLLGDWALSLWCPRSSTLRLARDFAGVRHLYYYVDRRVAVWSTALEAILPAAERPLHICEEYLAGWLSSYPAADLTPYREICGVPPACSVTINRQTVRVRRFWNFDPVPQIRYRSPEQYEEHFRSVFSASVKRRLRANRKVLAQLSGGMDSSSIVCVADAINRETQRPRVETVSYFSDSEPNWNERPYFTEVEKWRGRTGRHIDVGDGFGHLSLDNSGAFPATPNSLEYVNSAGGELVACIRTHGSRVLLSGTGGDEFTGGVPTPLPELADLLASFRIRRLWSQLQSWALAKRSPWIHLLADVARQFLPLAVRSTPATRQVPAWIGRDFARRNQAALARYPFRTRLFGARPSFQENLDALEVMRRQLASISPSRSFLIETRYPFLDRDLLSFLFAIPRDQLVRPGQRRFLMRRALKGIVPPLILERKRKAYVSKNPMKLLVAAAPTFSETAKRLRVEEMGIVDSVKLHDAFTQALMGKDPQIFMLLRVVALENWFETLANRHVLGAADAGMPSRQNETLCHDISLPPRSQSSLSRPMENST